MQTTWLEIQIRTQHSRSEMHKEAEQRPSCLCVFCQGSNFYLELFPTPSAMKIKSLSLKQNFSMLRKVAACCNAHPPKGHVLCKQRQLSCRCSEGRSARLRSHPQPSWGHLLQGTFTLQTTFPGALSAHPQSPPTSLPPPYMLTQIPSAECPPCWAHH